MSIKVWCPNLCLHFSACICVLERRELLQLHSYLVRIAHTGYSTRSCKAKVAYFELSVLRQEQILRFEIPVYDVMLVAIGDSLHQLIQQSLDL